ncbi:MAG TPA: helix-turn-helix transcriptional regulator [Pseudonocardiaceae bacterium]
MEAVVTLPVGRQWFGCYATNQSGADLRLITGAGGEWTYRDTGLPARHPLTLLKPGGATACLPLDGTVLVRQRGVEHRLEPGRFGVFAGEEPATATYSAQCRVLNLAMAAPSASTARLGRPLPVSGASELLVRHVQATMRVAPTLGPAALAAAAAAAGELFAATVTDADWQPSQAALASQIALYVDSRLCDPHLSVHRIAAAHHISVRTLYRIFARRGDTVQGHLRARRLDRAHHDLLTRSDLSVSAICARWGIADVSHFARQYRARFGCTPRETLRGADRARSG